MRFLDKGVSFAHMTTPKKRGRLKTVKEGYTLTIKIGDKTFTSHGTTVEDALIDI